MKKRSLLLFAIVLFTGLCLFAQPAKEAKASEIKQVAIICDPVGVNPFLTQVVDKMAELKAAKTYPMDYTVMECADDTSWAENIRASVEENYDLVKDIYSQIEPFKNRKAGRNSRSLPEKRVCSL